LAVRAFSSAIVEAGPVPFPFRNRFGSPLVPRQIVKRRSLCLMWGGGRLSEADSKSMSNASPLGGRSWAPTHPDKGPMSSNGDVYQLAPPFLSLLKSGRANHAGDASQFRNDRTAFPQVRCSVADAESVGQLCRQHCHGNGQKRKRERVRPWGTPTAPHRERMVRRICLLPVRADVCPPAPRSPGTGRCCRLFHGWCVAGGQTAAPTRRHRPMRASSQGEGRANPHHTVSGWCDGFVSCT
jgi:hypothetical protein